MRAGFRVTQRLWACLMEFDACGVGSRADRRRACASLVRVVRRRAICERCAKKNVSTEKNSEHRNTQYEQSGLLLRSEFYSIGFIHFRFLG